MTAYELADRLTIREFLQWDEFYALEAEAVAKANGDTVQRRKRRRS